MPKQYTFPDLFNDALQLNISKLKEWDYLNPDQIRTGTVTWSRNENKRGAITITVNTKGETPYVELDYKYQDEPRNYRVNLVSVPSNLGIGVVWYFECPETEKRCRKLYSIGGYFLHREAFKGALYESQTQSKKYRELDKTFGAYFKLDESHEQLYKKHFKKTYNGKPTKRYLQLISQIEKLERKVYLSSC